jgi:hypothetical protein
VQGFIDKRSHFNRGLFLDAVIAYANSPNFEAFASLVLALVLSRDVSPVDP